MRNYCAEELAKSSRFAMSAMSRQRMKDQDFASFSGKVAELQIQLKTRTSLRVWRDAAESEAAAAEALKLREVCEANGTHVARDRNGG